ncbi:MAG: AAA family ATPase [Eubacteriales bacterium]
MHEKLEITNFLSISHLEWEPKAYNIITGEMGSGKSVCMKLLYFIYEIFNVTIFNNFSNDIFKQEEFYSKLKVQFLKLFNINMNVSSKIEYLIDSTKQHLDTFDFCIKIDEGNISFESKYINKHLENWKLMTAQGLKQNKFDDDEQIKKAIFQDIATSIGSFFPFGQIYFSDLRTLLAEPNTIIPTDECTREMLAYKGILGRSISQAQRTDPTRLFYNDTKQMKSLINKIFKILHITDVENSLDGTFLIHNGRKTAIDKCSSGQRELFYLLNFIVLMQTSTFSYGNTAILFIEEPEAHLFPNEQKMILELLGEVFNLLNENGVKWRFFITTHSPYILNALNNMLFKSVVLKKCNTDSKKIEQVNAAVPFPPLAPEKVSAIFIKKTDNGCSSYDMIEQYEDTPFLFSEEIEKITSDIADDYNTLRNLFSSDLL